jgi:hypothetical protein
VARRTRGNYGYCLGVSKFVRVRDKWIAGVNKQEQRGVQGWRREDKVRVLNQGKCWIRVGGRKWRHYDDPSGNFTKEFFS